MRRLSLFSGLAILAAIWLGPLLDAWRESFAAHMLAHMGVVAVAAPLIAIGLTGPDRLLSNRLPAEGLGNAGRNWLLSTPVIASLLELIVVWGWHAPAMRALAGGSIAGTAIEQASFLVAGLFLWTTCLGARPDDAAGNGAGAFGLLLTTVHMTLLGALLALAPRPLYGSGDVTCFGFVLDARSDQELGGVLMLLIGAAVYLCGGLVLLARLLVQRPARANIDAG